MKYLFGFVILMSLFFASFERAEADAYWLNLVTTEGLPAPGAEGGVSFANNSYASGPNYSFGGSSDTRLFSTTLSGPGVTAANDSGLWLGRHFVYSGETQGNFTTSELVIREGQSAPGTPAGAVYADIPASGWGSSLCAAKYGDSNISFVAGLTGSGINDSNNAGLWSGSLGNFHLVAQKGDTAAGTDAVFQDFCGIHMIGANRLVFLATLSGPGADSSNDLGLWGVDDGGLAVLLARTGELIQTNDSQQIVTWISFYPPLFSLLLLDRPEEYVYFEPADGDSTLVGRLSLRDASSPALEVISTPEPDSVVLLLVAVTGLLVIHRQLPLVGVQRR